MFSCVVIKDLGFAYHIKSHLGQLSYLDDNLTGYIM